MIWPEFTTRTIPFTRRPRAVDLTGQVFHRLTVIGLLGSRNKKYIWLCRCLCGNTTQVQTSYLKNNTTKSCGCLHVETAIRTNTTHGMISTPTWRAWSSMKRRCYNPNCKGYKSYGGRGIKVCARWKDSFENFLADMGVRPDGLTLDRKDNEGNYEPSNCRWATWDQQRRNKRNSRRITYNGETKTVCEWAEIFHMKYGVLLYRLNRHWPIHKALTQVVR